ncbi:MAG: cobalt-zinc-cadmium efflux system membrane fusion protein [Gammaproteobacteria bacterium]|jgi:cobalt-zinc-cadmium efflux system membrane fusion protein
MIRNALLTLVIIIATVFAARWLLNSPESHNDIAGHVEQEQDFPRGPHNGRLLQDGLLALEITIFESGVPPEFHIYPSYQDKAIDPESVNVNLELGRTGNTIDQFEFESQGEYLRGDNVVAEPHSFDVSVRATYQGKNYSWTYDSYEGRTQISRELASEAGIMTEIAAPATITESLLLTGRVEIDPNRLSQIRPRFPGVVQDVHVELGSTVKNGQRMLTVQSNESLQNYSLKAPISGLVIKRNVQIGEATSEDPLFTIVDLSHVWVELDIFAKDLEKVKQGQIVMLETLDGFSAKGSINWLSPLSSHASQSIHARVPLDNPDGRLRPGQFVQAKVIIDEHEVLLAVKRSAVQTFRDFQVVFAKFDETYEVRMLEFGVSNDEWLEVVSGLAPGTEYVTENSYLIKADIEKSGASHDH